MNIICKLIGHRFVTRIYNTASDLNNYYIDKIEFPFCKRCGLSKNEAARLIFKKCGVEK